VHHHFLSFFLLLKYSVEADDELPLVVPHLAASASVGAYPTVVGPDLVHAMEVDTVATETVVPDALSMEYGAVGLVGETAVEVSRIYF